MAKRRQAALNGGVLLGIFARVAGAPENEVIMEFRRVRRWFVSSISVAAANGAILLCLAPSALAQSFPFGSELLLDVNPMRGSKKIPVLDIGENGTAEIE